MRETSRLNWNSIDAFVVSFKKMQGTIDELMNMAASASRGYDYFVFEVVQGGLQVRFTNDDPRAEKRVTHA